MTSPDEESPNTPSALDELREAETLTMIIRALQSLVPEARQRVLNAVLAFLGMPGLGHSTTRLSTARLEIDPQYSSPKFSDDRTPSAKQFLLDKRPQTDVERVACLAYYLTHYQNTPHFKTLDLSKLNTDAAQIKLSNPTVAVDNATKSGFLAQASKGNKQLSALGELYVQALPDREAARAAVAHARPRRKTRRPAKASEKTDNDRADGE
jgi:hypothetical protein